jgi:4'-phosphopantetheinyl transferase
LSLDENPASGNDADRAPGIVELAPPAPEIRLWWCRLDASPAQLRHFEALLAPPEHARAAKFGLPQLRDRYVAGRGSLRTILGQLLRLPAADVPIVRGMRGRPQLAGDGQLDFNVSHTASIALVGVLRDARVGVDVERLDRTINVAGIARKFLTQRERDALPRERDAARQRILALWTCKEAMSKATGDALSAPFGALDVALAERRRLVGGPGAYRPEHWTLHAAGVPQDYVATVAVWKPPR